METQTLEITRNEAAALIAALFTYVEKYPHLDVEEVNALFGKLSVPWPPSELTAGIQEQRS